MRLFCSMPIVRQSPNQIRFIGYVLSLVNLVIKAPPVYKLQYLF